MATTVFCFACGKARKDTTEVCPKCGARSVFGKQAELGSKMLNERLDKHPTKHEPGPVQGWKW